jgi:hypothetical protein
MKVKGYTDQPQTNIELANEGKELEERYLRWLDKLDNKTNTDKRCLALARTNIQQGAMWAIRSIFRPERIDIED